MASTDPRRGEAGYERRDVDAGKIGAITGVILLFSFLCAVPMWVLYRHFEQREIAQEPEPTSLTRAQAPSEPPAPRLEPVIGQTLAELRAHEAQILGSYGWVDPRAGAVRVPIERAIELVAEAGLPSRPGAPPFDPHPDYGRGSDATGGASSRASAPAAPP